MKNFVKKSLLAVTIAMVGMGTAMADTAFPAGFKVGVVDVSAVVAKSAQVQVLRAEQQKKLEELQKWLDTVRADVAKQQTKEGQEKLIKKYDVDFAKKSTFLDAVIISCNAVITYAERYAALAREMAAKEFKADRKKELLEIAEVCTNVPRHGSKSFREACQTFWFLQQVLQIESSGHSISAGRFDQYMYPYYEKSINDGTITRDQFWSLAKFKYPTHQIVFCTDESLKCLTYRGYEEVK